MIPFEAFDATSHFFAPLLCAAIVLAILGAGGWTRQLIERCLTGVAAACRVSDPPKIAKLYTAVITIVLPLFVLVLYLGCMAILAANR